MILANLQCPKDFQIIDQFEIILQFLPVGPKFLFPSLLLSHLLFVIGCH